MANAKDQYEQLMQLYDLTEELADTVESRLVADPKAQLELVAPIIEEVGEATDVLTEAFIQLTENKSRHAQSCKGRVEASLRKIYIALDQYAVRAGHVKQNATSKLRNIADVAVEKLRAQIEKVVIIFLGLIDLSLDRVMHKQELDDLKRRETAVAMHLQAMAAQAH